MLLVKYKVFETCLKIINYPTNIYLFKVSSRNTIKMCYISSKLRIKVNDVVYVILNIWLLALILFTPFSTVSIVNFEQVNVSWAIPNSAEIFLKFFSDKKHNKNKFCSYFRPNFVLQPPNYGFLIQCKVHFSP